MKRAFLALAFLSVAASCGRGERKRAEPPVLVPVSTPFAAAAMPTVNPTPPPPAPAPTPFPAPVVPPGLLHDRTGEAAAVRSIQRELVAKGFAPGYPDGLWGTHTREAFEELERARDLPADGLADPEALRALFGPSAEVQRVRGVDEIAEAPEAARGSVAATLALGALGGLILAAVISRFRDRRGRTS